MVITKTRPRLLVLGREIQFLDVSNTVLIVSLERHGSVMEEGSSLIKPLRSLPKMAGQIEYLVKMH